MDKIIVKGARENNLKNVNLPECVEVNKQSFLLFTSLSKIIFQKIESIENISKFLESTLSAFFDNMKGEINAKKTTFCISTNYFMLFIRM